MARAKRDPEIVLASQSEARKRLLERAGFRFRIRPAYIDEESVQKRIAEPSRLARELARQKARAIALHDQDAIVIGSDQLLVSEGRIFGKPHTPAKARSQLRSFSGKWVELLTAVCVIAPGGRERVFLQRTRMKFRELTDREIRDYVAADEPLECAGSFKFESLGIMLFEAVKTDDPTAIEGLPILRLGQEIRAILANRA